MSATGLIDPAEPLERQNQKLLRICEALMKRVEQGDDDRGAAYSQFQRAVLLEDQVRERTRDLEHALDLLNESNARLAAASRETERARSDLAGAIETVQEGFALFDPDDRMVLCNSRFAMHLPDIRHALRPGLTFADYVALVSRSAFLDLPPGMTREEWSVDRMARHGEMHVVFNVRMAGSRWVQVSEHRMAAGQTVIMQTDVSDIIRAEREEQGKLLDDQARLIRATLEHIDQGVCIVDPRGRLAGVNRRLASVLGLPLTHLRSGLDFELVLSRLRTGASFGPDATPEEVLAWVRQEGRRRPLRFELRRGESQWFDVFAEEMPDGGFVMSLTDVSAEREAAQALSEANELLEARVASRTLELEDALGAAERANASRTRFVAAASHDLLQPLSAAKLYLSSITDELADPHHREVVTKAQNALASVQDIIEALLDISKLESGRAAADVRTVDLGALLNQLRDEFAPAAALKGLRLTVRPTSLRITTDPTYIKRILQNLLANAIRYTEKGRVLVAARRTGGSARIGVWDTGPGIPESEQENIFKEFHRLGRRASASEGLGLGLAIVDRACAMLGHPLTLASVPGRGTAFTVSVPLAERSSHIPAEARRAAAGDWRHDGLCVLVIENDLDMRRALALLLGSWGVRVLDAGSADEAIRQLQETGLRPDALLVDFQLDDGETGVKVIGRLRRRLGRVPARIVTANRTSAVAAQARRIGVETLYKPLDPLMLHLFLGSLALGRTA
ncbi:PAS-domain containing protein [Rubellimicrobium aerolatum]|uniref:histidine kinase n=1 Tax=Rubellimicrobium aerolatum TaxID=490979 RepID=A0ABW0S9D6_9RHOB|nr:PAS-domain containing protein [Rubellimicrobium aerolatum]MBP1804869.1 signal transduction histidine kinase/CheY-like chemotaxis protein [Rubellimicrobium aerolatum]